jgi:hypothetical protein
MGSGLTPKQKRTIKDLDEIYAVIGIDYWNIEDYERESRSGVLELQRRKAIVGGIIVQYTVIDEMMNWDICRHFFGPRKSSMQLWRTKKFQNFNYYILERLSLIEKLELVKTFYREIPGNIVKDIYILNDLRNAVAHAFFVEDLRKYKKEGKAVYKGKDIFTVEGVDLFMEDMGRVNEFFINKGWT